MVTLNIPAQTKDGEDESYDFYYIQSEDLLNIKLFGSQEDIENNNFIRGDGLGPCGFINGSYCMLYSDWESEIPLWILYVELTQTKKEPATKPNNEDEDNEDDDVIPTVSSIRDLDITVVKTADFIADAIIVRLPDGKNMLIDAGDGSVESNRDIKARLTALNITTIDYFIVTTPIGGRSGGGMFIFENYVVKNFYRPNVKSTHESVANLPTEYNSGATSVCLY